MGFLEDLKDAAKPADAYLAFIKAYPSKENKIHAFFEGEDDFSFYPQFIKAVLEKDYPIEKYDCGGKAKVYELYSKVMSRVNDKIQVLFFVDKDHSDLIKENYITSDKIYVTDYYSIENFLVTESILYSVCEEIYHIKNSDPHLELIIKKFRKELNKYYLLILPIIAWIIYTRKTGKKVNLNNVDLKKIFYFNDDLEIVRKSPDKYNSRLKYLDISCNVSTPKTVWRDILSVARELSLLQPKIHLRGKFELWFLVEFLTKLKTCKDSSGKFFFKPSTQISMGNAVEILGPRASCPASLNSFLIFNLVSEKTK